MIYVQPELDHAVWIDVPPHWGGDSWRDEHQWADEVAQGCWKATGESPHVADVDRLSAVLALCAQKWGPGSVHPEHSTDPSLDVHVILHLPHPSAIPFPLRLLVASPVAAGSDFPTLRQFVIADDPDAIDPPEVHEIGHPTLGRGLGAFRHHEDRTGPSKDGTYPVYAMLRYAFPVPSHSDVVLVDVTWADLGRLAAAREDIERLVQSLTWQYLPDRSTGPDPETPAVT